MPAGVEPGQELTIHLAACGPCRELALFLREALDVPAEGEERGAS